MESFLTVEMLETLVNLVVIAISVIVTRFLIPYLKTKMSKDQRELLLTVVNQAVLAAEQIYAHADKSGKTKKQYVIDFIKSRGIKISNEEIDVLIEAAVKELNMYKDELVK